MLSAAFSLVYLTVSLNYDKEIMRLCERLGFNITKSKKLKITILFYGFLIMIITQIIGDGADETWSEKVVWIINTSAKEGNCSALIDNRKAGFVGLENTRNQEGNMFYVYGLAFGMPFSLEYVDFIEFVLTPIWKKCIRGLLAFGLSLCILAIFQFTIDLPGNNDHTYHLLMFNILPNFLVTFIVSGPFIIVCQYLGLVGTKN